MSATVVTRLIAPAGRTFSTSSKTLSLKAASPMESMPTSSATTTTTGSWTWNNWSPKARRYATYAGIGLVADGLLVYHFYPSFFQGSTGSEPSKV